ncbi:MAG: hypothetical protein ABI721_03795 [Candidatus Dojkabacteria bacterium]
MGNTYTVSLEFFKSKYPLIGSAKNLKDRFRQRWLPLTPHNSALFIETLTKYNSNQISIPEEAKKYILFFVFSGKETREDLSEILEIFEEEAYKTLKNLGNNDPIGKVRDLIDADSPKNLLFHEFQHGAKAVELGVSDKVEFCIFLTTQGALVLPGGLSLYRRHAVREATAKEQVEILISPDYLSEGDRLAARKVSAEVSDLYKKEINDRILQKPLYEIDFE